MLHGKRIYLQKMKAPFPSTMLRYFVIAPVKHELQKKFKLKSFLGNIQGPTQI